MIELLAKLLDLPLGYFLIVIAAILLLTAGVGKFKGLIDPGKPGRIFSGVIGIPLVMIGLVLSVGFPSVTPAKVGLRVVTPTSVATSPPTQTPALQPVGVNRQVVCVSNCDSAVVQVTVVSLTPDRSQNRTVMLLSLDAPYSNYSGCSFGSDLNFQDSTGKTYEPGGQLEPYSSFSLVQGQPLQLTAIYSFVPSSGSTYTLRTSTLGCNGVSPFPIYEDAQFTFSDAQ